MTSIYRAFDLMGNLIVFHANYQFHCCMCLKHYCHGFPHFLVVMGRWTVAVFVHFLVGHESGLRDSMNLSPSTKTKEFTFQYYSMSISQTLSTTKIFGTPFPHFIKVLSPIICPDELGECPWKQLKMSLWTSFLSTNNTIGSYIEYVVNCGDFI